MSNQDLNGKIAVVTGGAVGIGAAIAQSLAARGARIVFTYHSHAPSQQALDALRTPDQQEAIAYSIDLTSESAVEEFGSEIEREVGKVDILVHNAGGLVERSRIEEMPYTLFRNVQTLNVDSVFLLSKRLIPLMPEEGRIVIVASLAGRSGGHPGATAYATAKAALFGFTRGLSKEVADRRITVNAVAPGFIEATPFHDTFTTEASKQHTITTIPLGRAGVPDDVASAVSWLASPGASFVTGTIIDINGGQHFS
ncbi:SDR family NAD(P)-dependent oxidoreductase [Carnimonas bestiolae]|uniref:SDR family NAD(P)-dependent oxidoreductase n=1 Tax=Carnimonas bestiolae TaxID=3402172 RepID=UPI003EDC5F76